MKILSPRIHGYLDFVVVALFALAPSVFGFSGTPAYLSYALAGIHLTMTLTTAFPMGLIKLVPFTIHGAIELLVSLFLAAAPWVFGFADKEPAKIFYVAAGILILVVFLLTDYKAAEADPASHAKASAG